MWRPNRTLAALATVALALAACTAESDGNEPKGASGGSSPGADVPSFSDPTRVTNKYLPLAKGGRWIYEGKKKAKPYLVEIAVTDTTKTVRWAGESTETMVVRHRGWVNGKLIEEAFDYYGQGDDGGVWHFGENVDNYKGGELANHDGSWLVGVDGAQPGLLMPGAPQPGQTFVSQNVVDLGIVQHDKVVSVDKPAETPAGPTDNGLLLKSTQPDGSTEEKVFVPGVGEVLTRTPDGAVRLVRRPAQDAESASAMKFSSPTTVDNPYFGVTGVDHRLYFGRDEGEPLRIEVALTGKTKPISWKGGKTETVVSQFLESSGRELLEIAVDWFAQDDAGNVWYFGENVWNYEEGRIANTDGSWKAGADGPPGMIMPGDPVVGQRFNPENIPGVVFETVDLQALDATYKLPTGARHDEVLKLHETLDDGTEEFKLYAPGYGNVHVNTPGIETVKIVYALPNDAIDAPVPAELSVMLDGLRDMSTSGSGDLARVRGALNKFTGRDDAVPASLIGVAHKQLSALDEALARPSRDETRMGALDLEQTVLDIARLYRTERPVDLDVLDLYARRIFAAADAGDRTIAATAAAMARAVSDRSATILSAKAERAAVATDTAADEGKLADILRAASKLRAAVR